MATIGEFDEKRRPDFSALYLVLANAALGKIAPDGQELTEGCLQVAASALITTDLTGRPNFSHPQLNPFSLVQR